MILNNCPFCDEKTFENQYGDPCITHKDDCYFNTIYVNQSVQITNIDKWNKRSTNNFLSELRTKLITMDAAEKECIQNILDNPDFPG